jgi:hypothetical protein
MESAHRYYTFLEKSAQKSWIDILLDIETSKNYGIPEVLTLLHPRYYQELNTKEPRGEREFNPARPQSRCRSLELWGYSCPFTNSVIHIDHMFPWAKGGATHYANAMYLCREHNMSKNTDIHVIPWESFPNTNEWIVNPLTILLQAAERLTQEKLYFPKAQTSRS